MRDWNFGKIKRLFNWEATTFRASISSNEIAIMFSAKLNVSFFKTKRSNTFNRGLIMNQVLLRLFDYRIQKKNYCFHWLYKCHQVSIEIKKCLDCVQIKNNHHCPIVDQGHEDHQKVVRRKLCLRFGNKNDSFSHLDHTLTIGTRARVNQI